MTPNSNLISNRIALQTTMPAPIPFLIGIAAALGIFGLYFGLLTLTSDWNNAKMQFAEDRWWIIALSAGLGIQAALFSFLPKQMTQDENIRP